MAQAYGIFNAERGTSNRAVIIVDKQGIVRFKRIYNNAADVKPEDILLELDKL